MFIKTCQKWGAVVLMATITTVFIWGHIYMFMNAFFEFINVYIERDTWRTLTALAWGANLTYWAREWL